VLTERQRKTDERTARRTAGRTTDSLPIR